MEPDLSKKEPDLSEQEPIGNILSHDRDVWTAHMAEDMALYPFLRENRERLVAFHRKFLGRSTIAHGNRRYNSWSNDLWAIYVNNEYGVKFEVKGVKSLNAVDKNPGPYIQKAIRAWINYRAAIQLPSNLASFLAESPALRVYLDDERPTPEGWVGARWPEDVIALIQKGGVEIVSLDHDLGDDARGTGYDVITWLERETHENPQFIAPKVLIHTQNPSARLRMELGRTHLARIADVRRKLAQDQKT